LDYGPDLACDVTSLGYFAGDIDLDRNLVTIKGKGDKVATLPLVCQELVEDLRRYMATRSPDEYLLYRRSPKGP